LGGIEKTSTKSHEMEEEDDTQDVFAKNGCQRRQSLKCDLTSMGATPITLCYPDISKRHILEL